MALEPSMSHDSANDELGISVVIPCLNEVRTIAGCVGAATDGIKAAGLEGEVIVADNGSTDGSGDAAEAAGARVVRVSRRGYGAALKAGFLAARGRLLVMGDADQSYDFRELPKLVEEQRRTGADIVLGDRLGGHIEAGAMPWTHRWIGNPLISFTIRRLFQVPLSDCYCGLRLLTRDSHRRLRLNASSMEYALEMIVQGALVGLRFSQVPITLHVDGRDKAPHLHTVRDGYRSFRFLFQHAPITLYGVVGGPAIVLGLALLTRAAWLEVHGGPPAIATAALGGGFVISGWLLGVLGIIARVFVTGFLGGQAELPLLGLFRVARLETAVLASAVTLLVGLSLVIGFGHWEALLQLGLTLSIVAIGTFVGAFVVSLVGRAIPDYQLDEAPAQSLSQRVVVAPPQIPSPEDGATVATRRIVVPAPNYDRWIADNLRGAWDGAGRVLDFGSSVSSVTLAVAEAATGDRMIVYRIDPAAALEYARPLARVAAEAESALPYDVVVSAGLLECIDDDVAALRSMAAWLRPYGRLVLFVPGGGDRLYGPLDVLAGHFRRYTVPRLRSRLGAAGFQAVHIRRMDMLGAVRWIVQGCAARSRRSTAEAVRPFDRAVPVLRRIEAVLGPPFGQWLVAIAQLRP